LRQLAARQSQYRRWQSHAGTQSGTLQKIELWYNFCYTLEMKTAISIPDKIFEAAEKAAKKLGMSRSELYVNAVREYVDRYGQEDVTEKLDAIYSNPRANSSIDYGLTTMQNASLPKEDW